MKYACKELLRLGTNRKELLGVTDEAGKRSVLSDDKLEKMHTWTVNNKKDLDHLKAWVSCLEKYGVFFSKPLDLDFALLRKFPEAYKSIVEEGVGPSIPKPSSKTTRTSWATLSQQYCDAIVLNSWLIQHGPRAVLLVSVPVPGPRKAQHPFRGNKSTISGRIDQSNALSAQEVDQRDENQIGNGRVGSDVDEPVCLAPDWCREFEAGRRTGGPSFVECLGGCWAGHWQD